MLFKKLFAAVSAVALAAVLFAAPASAQASGDDLEKTFAADLAPINVPGGGTAEVTVSGGQATVIIEAADLSPAVAPHAQHIHGVIGAPNQCPDPDTADSDGDGIVTTAEGVPFYGGIQVALTTSGDMSPDSGLATDRFPVTEGGAYTYERTFPIAQQIADSLGNHVIVIHGADLNASGEYDGDARSSINPDLPLEATVPTACGELMLRNIDLPAAYDGAAGAEGSIVRLYVTLLDRTPDAGGFDYWVDRLQTNDVKVIARAIAGSAEFEARYGDVLQSSTGEWVDFVYGAVLGRNPDTSGQQYWVAQIDQGNLSRIGMLTLFANSAEFRGLTGTS
ncbi:MAG TPA: DUF4214 domain-containing protein [Acidimicrobiales bacterium]|nr:DUF4214 domain-containing protein [Acidimicrobiales bacterium]